MNKPLFSLVIPCYNDGRYAPTYYIDRLLSNLLEQGLQKEELEVIIADDHSPIPYQGTLDRYKDKLNIKFIETDYNFAPGNTRQKGSEIATGEWLCFADHDDLFYKGALHFMKLVIEKYNPKYIVYSDFNKVDSSDLVTVLEEFRDNRLNTWVHGKFYNIENFWRPYHLHFIKDLKTHEDLALGRQVECALHKLGAEALYAKSPTYKWVYNKDSVSHGTYVDVKDEDGTDHPFLEIHFNDFLISQVDVILDCYKDDIVSKNEAIFLTLSGLSTAYMSVCTFKFKNSDHYLKTTEAYCSRVLDRIINELELSISAIKVFISTSLGEALTRVNTVADECKQPHLADWFDYINKLDYRGIINQQEKVLSQPKKEDVNALAKQRGRKKKSDKNHRPFFSIVIPCYNDGRYKEGVYLDRLLSSIAKQGILKEDLEVICSDDCSPIPFDHIMKKHEDEMILKYIKTDYNYCPGNTRAKGVTIATGEWLCFADHDDIYYDGGLKAIRNSIEEKNEQHFAFGDFDGVSPEGKVIRKYECHLNWCHGKFYNKDNFWDKYNIHFIKDLKSHEDIAICTQVSCLLSSEIENYTYLHRAIYAWTDNPQSVSHAKYTVDTETGPREFLEVFFDDYVHSTGYIYLDKFRDHSINMVNAIKWCVEIMCYCYFYTQGFQFRKPEDFYRINLDVAGKYVSECKKTFNLTNESIYNLVASNGAYMYYQIRGLADPGSGRYIPQQTLQDWLDIVSPDV